MKKNAFNRTKGWIEVICGPMFAGKSEELLRRINRFQYAEISYVLFKPTTDTRTKKEVKSRDGRALEAIEIKSPNDILEYLSKNKHTQYDAIAIEEGQFFDKSLGEVCNTLANQGYAVYVAGLDLDFRGNPFESMAYVLAYADHVTKLTAICTVCGAEANRTQRMINGKPASINDPLVLIGDQESYEARCRTHHIVKK